MKAGWLIVVTATYALALPPGCEGPRELRLHLLAHEAVSPLPHIEQDAARWRQALQWVKDDPANSPFPGTTTPLRRSPSSLPCRLRRHSIEQSKWACLSALKISDDIRPSSAKSPPLPYGGQGSPCEQALRTGSQKKPVTAPEPKLSPPFQHLARSAPPRFPPPCLASPWRLRMTRNSRSEQARVNGAKSRGPVSPQGKYVASLNAIKTGRYAANKVVLSVEDSAAFRLHCQDYLHALNPRNPIEYRLCRELAALDWRLSRCHAVDAHLLEREIHNFAAREQKYGVDRKGFDLLAHAEESFLQRSTTPTLLAARESHLLRSRRQTLALLLKLRTQRSVPKNEPKARSRPQTVAAKQHPASAAHSPVRIEPNPAAA
jgi:hypothetical protein